MNLVGLADCKGVAVGALGHPRVELELLLQVLASFLQVPYLGPHSISLRDRCAFTRGNSVTGINCRTCSPWTSTLASRAVGGGTPPSLLNKVRCSLLVNLTWVKPPDHSGATYVQRTVFVFPPMTISFGSGDMNTWATLGSKKNTWIQKANNCKAVTTPGNLVCLLSQLVFQGEDVPAHVLLRDPLDHKLHLQLRLTDLPGEQLIACLVGGGGDGVLEGFRGLPFQSAFLHQRPCLQNHLRFTSYTNLFHCHKVVLRDYLLKCLTTLILF